MALHKTADTVPTMRRYLVLQLSLSGKSNRDVAVELEKKHGIKISHAQVWRDLQHILKDEAAKNADAIEEYREMQNKRYQAIVEAHWENRADPKHAHIIMKALDSIRRVWGLDRELGSEERPLTTKDLDDERKPDLSKLTDDELARFLAVLEAEQITGA